MPAKKKTGTKSSPALSRKRILTLAIRIADRDGTDKTSMRKVAQAAGVEAMSLYNHVANKDDLLCRQVCPAEYWQQLERRNPRQRPISPPHC